jgi:hypothetical protein
MHVPHGAGQRLVHRLTRAVGSVERGAPVAVIVILSAFGLDLVGQDFSDSRTA